MEYSKTKRYRTLLNEMKADVDGNGWREMWKDLSEYVLPRSGRYLESNNDNNTNKGTNKTQKIINSVATKSVKNLSAGMQGGLTSPARPWFVLSLPDENMMEVKAVRQWLHDVRQQMLNVFARSNFYAAVHNLYKEIGTFGVGALLIEEDLETVIRVRPFTIGEYYVGLDSNYRVDTFVRQFSMTAKQMVEKFGEEEVSSAVKSSFTSNNALARFEVIHCIVPNDKINTGKQDHRGMAYKSIYFEKNGDQNKVLKEGGYTTKPFAVPRWEIYGTDTYGGSPGMDSLSDIKMLQSMEIDKLKTIHKHVDPPMNAPSSMKNIGGTIIGGDVNYVDVPQGTQGFTPAYQTRGDITSITYEIESVSSRIKEGFFNNLFLAIMDTQKNMTATEVAERHGEKMLLLSPVLERLQAEFLDPVIERTFFIMEELGMLPEAPKELSNTEIRVEYISLLAQAQKMVGTKAVEQLTGFVGSIAGMNPEVLDKFDFDEAVDQYADMVGVPPKLIRTDDQVAEIRQARQAAQAKAAQQEQAAQDVAMAKTLSDTQVDNDSALDAVTGLGTGEI